MEITYHRSKWKKTYYADPTYCGIKVKRRKYVILSENDYILQLHANDKGKLNVVIRNLQINLQNFVGTIKE